MPVLASWWQQSAKNVLSALIPRAVVRKSYHHCPRVRPIGLFTDRQSFIAIRPVPHSVQWNAGVEPTTASFLLVEEFKQLLTPGTIAALS